jgi:hypothetical protein
MDTRHAGRRGKGAAASIRRRRSLGFRVYPTYDELEALERYAHEQDRPPQVQAQRFIREGLIAAGALSEGRGS